MAQAAKFKKLSAEGKLTYDKIDAIMSVHKEDSVKLTLKGDVLEQYFPKNYSAGQMEKVIIGLLEAWRRKQLQKAEGR